MPENGIKYMNRKDLLSYEEMLRMVSMMAEMGISKLRITGGEPFVRKDMLKFLAKASEIQGIEEINITTNGTVTGDIIPELEAIGINSINLSLDSLDRERFAKITRRDMFPQVWDSFEKLMKSSIKTKINAVVMEGQNIEDLIPMAELTKTYPVDVRYIEEMPFNGEGNHYPVLKWHHRKILEHLTEAYPEIEKVPDPFASTASNYRVPGHRGKLGIIAAFSRTFCGSCNRIRVTPKGLLKTCLYDGGVLSIRDLMRTELNDEEIKTHLAGAFSSRAKDGFEAEEKRKENPVSESMATIGG
jgi:cyclic pyranopterin phosphate synthase